MRQYNLSVLQKELKAHGYGADTGREVLEKLADAILQWLKGKQYSYKDDTFNLTDSTGCALYEDGKIVKLYMLKPQQATELKTYMYKRVTYTISGRELLNKLTEEAPVATMGKYSLVIAAEAPYASWVNDSLGDGGPNKRGKDWFNDLKDFATKRLEELINGANR